MLAGALSSLQPEGRAMRSAGLRAKKIKPGRDKKAAKGYKGRRK